MRSTPFSRNSTRFEFDIALQQEVTVLLPAVLVHAAAAVTARLVAQIQPVVLGAVLELEQLRRHAFVPPPCAALGAARLVFLR